MRNTTKISLVIISALLLSACNGKTPTGTNQAAAPTEQSQSSSIRDLIALGKNQQCTVSMSQTDDKGIKTDTTGTIYISGKNLAEQVQIVSSDPKVKTINMMMISDGTTMYTWDQSGTLPGMKLAIPTPAATGTTPSNTQTQSVDLDKKFDMKCSNWAVDNSKFAVPTNIKFTDLTQLMKNIPTVPAVPQVPAVPKYGY